MIDDLLDQLSEQLGINLASATLRPVSGGDINQCYRVSVADFDGFLKLNLKDRFDMFQAEADGLFALAACRLIRVPNVIAVGVLEKHSYLMLEFLSLKPLQPVSYGRLGEKLAQLHHIPQTYFGWHRHNTIGSTSQHNTRATDWVTFWQQQRLSRQLELAKVNGYCGNLQRLGEKLLEKTPLFFQDYAPIPSLLHGDLWGGNAASLINGDPVIFDPACYYGDRETDVAMTELFGGFGREFYQAYQSVCPLDQGYSVRKILYNLYHILNHLNLFGSAYLSQSQNMIEKLLAEV